MSSRHKAPLKYRSVSSALHDATCLQVSSILLGYCLADHSLSLACVGSIRPLLIRACSNMVLNSSWLLCFCTLLTFLAALRAGLWIWKVSGWNHGPTTGCLEEFWWDFFFFFTLDFRDINVKYATTFSWSSFPMSPLFATWLLQLISHQVTGVTPMGDFMSFLPLPPYPLL